MPPEIQNKCDQPKCETGACSSDQVCEVYKNTVLGLCSGMLNKGNITGADITMSKYLNGSCKK